jgi:threonine/homoserine/homoserine lactone efflux protein
MPSAASLLLFVAASVVLIATPGPNVLYIFARSLSQGRAAGLASVAGVSVGNLVHACAAAIGLSAVLASSVLAFSVLKYLGAAYLVYLGIRKFLTKPAELGTVQFRPQPLGAIFRQGVVIGVLNPKVALFFLSFLPQFVDPRHGSAQTQLLVFGASFVVLGVIGDSLWALLSGSIGPWIRSSRRFQQNERFVTGSVYCGLGVVAALAGPAKT